MSTFVALLAAASPAAQERRWSNLGTLTCTLSGTASKPRVDAELSCNFKGLSGSEGSFTGTLARHGRADLPTGKRVLVWSVLSLTPDANLVVIAGRYRGITGGGRSHTLVGGKDDLVRLQPVTTPSRAGEEPAISVLELRLKATRA
jgi:hypothetical protein